MNYKKIIPLLIAVLGFTVSCNDDDDVDGDGAQPKYGIPSAEYQQKSKVPIENEIPNE